MVTYKVCFRSKIGDIATAEPVVTCSSDVFPSPKDIKEMIAGVNIKVAKTVGNECGIPIY